jgi:type IV pilus assembly protein PilM
MRLTLPKVDKLANIGRISPTTSPIAIDFGSRTMKILQLSAGSAPALVSAVQIETPETLVGDSRRRLIWQFSQLPKAIKLGGFKGKRATATLPAALTFCKHLQFPRSDSADIKTLVETALASQLQCDPAALVFRHVEVGPVAGGAKTEAIGFAAGREMVTQLMSALREAKLEPVGVMSEFAALIHAFDYLTRRDDDSKLSSLYLDIGFNTTNVAIAHGRDLVFARCIEHGGRSLDDAVTRQLKVDPSEASKIRLGLESLCKKDREAATETRPQPPVPKTEDANPDRRGGPVSVFSKDATETAPSTGANVAVDLTEALEIITDEISMCLRYYDAMFPGRRIDRAIFVGGESAHRGLCQSIARALRLPAQVADPLARIARTGTEPVKDVDLRTAQPGWAVAMGLCLGPTDL